LIVRERTRDDVLAGCSSIHRKHICQNEMPAGRQARDGALQEAAPERIVDKMDENIERDDHIELSTFRHLG